MKLLLIGNHTCGNRGDAAILRGLLARVEQLFPDAAITVTSRYPVSSTYLLGRPVIADPIYRWLTAWRSKLPARVKASYRARILPQLMARAIDRRSRWPLRFLPNSVRKVIAEIECYDVVVQVGGSFFVDLYGTRQFELPFAAILAGRPLVLLGHSMGPFGGRGYHRLAETLIRSADHVAVREPVSLDLLKKAGLPTADVRSGSDTAWLVDAAARTGLSVTADRWTGGRPAVALTLRDLAPFDRRLGVTQAEFERALALLADKIIGWGFDVIACSTCTGIDSYLRDDRMPALRVKAQVTDNSRFHVVMDELNDVELGMLLGSCDLLVGTRLHSAIIAMNFGTPAIALNYEHKSAGVMQQMGLPELASSVTALLDGSLAKNVQSALENLPQLGVRVALAVDRERERARQMVDDALLGYQPSAVV